MAYMHENEARYYGEVVPRTTINAPACYFAATDRVIGQSIVLLEDLRLRDVRFCHASHPLDYAQCAAFLDGIARFHAQWWNHRDLDDGGELGWILPQLRNLGEGGYRSRVLQPELWTAELWDEFLALPRCAAIPRALHDRERLRAGLNRLGDRIATMPVTLCHGDTHLGNLYLDADGTAGFRDAQVRRSSWAMDVAYHVVAALDIEDRREWERGLLGHYLDRLAAYGITPPGFDEAWLSYRCEIAYGLFVWTLNANAFQSETVNTYVNARFGAAATDHHSLDLLLG
jgi:aminoglycoside/choline kinase family phosphotransferase